LVPEDRVRVEVHPEIGQHTGNTLVCIEGYGADAEVIIAAEDDETLIEWFKKGGISHIPVAALVKR